MRYINRYILVFILIFFVSYSADANEVMRGTCIRVLDGDTVDIVSDGEHELFRVRLWGIDAPETSQPYGFAARRALADVILGKDVQVRILSVDLYGRCVGEVFQNSQNVNEYMLRQGLAWYYERYARNETRFRQDEASARVHRKGLWAGVQPEAPWNYRRRVRSGGKRMIVTPLVMAAIRGHVEVVKYLIDAGADADGVGGKLALLAAIRNNQVDVVRCLLENGVDVRTDNAVYNHDCTESAGEALSNETVTGHCIRVPDGDSIDVRLESGNLVRVHLWGVDAPELLQAHGAEAHQFLTELLAGEEVKVFVSGTDDNGGYVGRVYKGDECVNLQVLSHGWGWLNVQHGVSKPEYARAWQDACNRNCGLWAEAGAVNPQEVRGQDVLVNPAGSVALSLSVAVGNEEIIDMLRQHGAELTDVVSRLPMAYAARNSRPEFVRALANHGAPINGRVNVAGVGRRTLPRSNEQSTPLRNDNRRQFSVISENLPDNVSHGIRDEVYGLGYPESTIPAIHEDDSVSADEELLVSVYNGDLERIKAFVEGGGDINAAVDVYSSSVLRPCLSNMQFLENEADRELVLGTTPIIEAAKRGNSEVVRVLVSNGANVEVKDAFNTTATQYAEEKGRRDIVQELRRVSSASTRVSTANSSTQPSYTVPGGTIIPNPATTTSSSTVANGSPRPSPTSSVERTSAPLFEPTINRTSTTSRTSVPRSQPRRSSGRTYSSGGYSRHGNSYSRKNIKWYLIGGFVLFFVLVIICSTFSLEGLFLKAAKRKSTLFARLFFLFGLRYNPKDCVSGFSPLCVAVSCNNIELVKFLLKKGANPNIRKGCYSYPIHIAVSCNNHGMVKLLLEKGANPNICNYYREVYPIQTAVKCAEINILSCLIKSGADTKVLDDNGYNLYEIACMENRYDIAEWLESRGISTRDITSFFCKVFSYSKKKLQLMDYLLSKGGGSLGAIDSPACSVLYGALKNSNLKLAEILINKGANIEYLLCCLDKAIQSQEDKIAEFLIINGANVFYRPSGSTTLLNKALKKKMPRVAELIREVGGKMYAREQDKYCMERAINYSSNKPLKKVEKIDFSFFN